jgi:signal transduction histidine kinase/transcriptional regulator with GAF, ATPase, and Fis domain
MQNVPKIHAEKFGQRTIPAALIVGILMSLALLAWVVLDLPGAPVVRWIVVIPALVGLLRTHTRRQVQRIALPTAQMADELSQANAALTKQVEDLTRVRDVMLAMGATFDRKAILDELTHAITQLLQFDRGLVLLHDEGRNALVYGAYSHAAPDAESQYLLEQLQLAMDDAATDPLLGRWLKRESTLVEDATPYMQSRLHWLLNTLSLRMFYAVPLLVGDRFKGVILVDNAPTGMPISLEQRGLLDALAANIAVTLENARLYQLTDEKLNAKVQELHILSRIDRELNEALSIDRVLNLTLDWALRFTGSHAAAVALIDPDKEELRFVSGYGYDLDHWAQVQTQVWSLDQGITGRVARRGDAEIVADVTADPDYQEIFPEARSQLSVPIAREGRVIAVISLENRNPNAFTQENLEFVKRLAARAAAALDNARLFDETRREQQKLELILASTADAVIVVDYNDRLVVVNQAAMAVFRLSPKEHYPGREFAEIFMESPLATLYQRVANTKQGLIEEIKLPEDRTFHVSIVAAPQVGWSIVAHDVTPYKQTEQLKNELVATASHDLKNPLSVMLGYLDLIHMTNPLNTQGLEYMQRAQRSISHMRHLIDDLLDMARIESGIALRLGEVHVRTLVRNVVESFTIPIREKAMTIDIDVPQDLPPVAADESRLEQIVENLISNAIKYTPPEGHILVRAEPLDGFMKIVVQDNGLGISPEDQAQVFARFYRVRTPETESIEGTGLGLAIVKSLVEAHGGQMGLESHLGKGSTFHFTIPLSPTSPTNQPQESAAKSVSD